ncbi:MAG: excinuclease ABC subunit UvrC [Candidatus Kerfeldbacteria bacterium]
MADVRKKLMEKVRSLPAKPGVYQFLDVDKHLLYIGKATNLRSRVLSYFRDSADLSDAKRVMVRSVADVAVTVVDNESEALLLETTLIKKYKPPFNIVMKDDKNFQYIHITDDKYPVLETTRKIPLRGRSGKYFGPYISGFAVKRAMRLMKQLFHICTSPPREVRGKVVFPKRPCLDYQMGRCLGPCADVISADEYRAVFKQIEQFLRGDYEPVRAYVEREMVRASDLKQFEKAAQLRDQLLSIDKLMVKQKVVSPRQEDADYLSLARMDGTAAVNLFVVRRGKMIHQEVFFLKHTRDQSDDDVLGAFADQYYAQTESVPKNVYLSIESRRGRHKKMLEMGIENAGEALKRQKASFEKHDERAKKGLTELAAAIGLDAAKLGRIEIYDISNIQGKYSVGSMVVFKDGLAEPVEYRKFKIKGVVGANDVASLQEIVSRRVRHLPKKVKGSTQPWPRPDLIIVDGGKPQLNAVKAILDATGLKIPLISLAKREEEIFIPGESQSVLLKRNSEGLYLVQRMRDEAHRFAIGFYRKRHLKGMV